MLMSNFNINFSLKFSRKTSHQVNSAPKNSRTRGFDKVLRKSVPAPGDLAAADYITPRSCRWYSALRWKTKFGSGP